MGGQKEKLSILYLGSEVCRPLKGCFSLIKRLIAEGPRSKLTSEGDQRLDAGLCGRMEEGEVSLAGGDSSSFLCSSVEDDRGISLVSLPCGRDCREEKSGLIPNAARGVKWQRDLCDVGSIKA